MKKYKVTNDYGITIYLNFENLDGRVVKILPNSFAYITEDQLEYLSYTSDIVESGLLGLGDAAKELPDIKEQINENNVFSKEKINSLLELSVKAISDEVSKTDNLLGLQKLLQEAEKKDKAKGYIQAIEKRIEELM